MQIKRDDFLKALKLASLGTSSREVAAQSSFFMFTKNRIVGDNEMIHVSVPFETGIEGAISVEELLGVLSKITAPALTMEQEGDTVIFKSGRSKAGLNLYPLLRETVAMYQPLEEDKKLKEVFTSNTELDVALEACAPCCNGNLTSRAMSAICLTKDGMIATDNFQAIRVETDLSGLGDSVLLLPAEVIKSMMEIGYTRFLVNDDCRCVAVCDDGDFKGTWIAFDSIDPKEFPYPNLGDLFNGEGTQFNFPEGFINSIETAELFAKNALKSEEVMISISTTKDVMKVRGEGTHGFFEEEFEVKNDCKVTFYAKPKTLMFLLKQEGSAARIVADGTFPCMILENENSTYCVAIMTVEE